MPATEIEITIIIVNIIIIRSVST